MIGGSGCKQEGTNEQIYAFNMRNVIIHGRVNDPTAINARRGTVRVIFFILPGYLLLCLLSYCLCFGERRGTKDLRDVEIKMEKKGNEAKHKE